MKIIIKSVFMILIAVGLIACSSDKVDVEQVEEDGSSNILSVPTGIDNFQIGMGLEEFLKNFEATEEVTCDDWKIYSVDGWSYVCPSFTVDKTQIIRNRVEDVDFVVVRSPLDKSIGFSGGFGFIDGRLAAIQIDGPMVSRSDLVSKHGKPAYFNHRRKEICNGGFLGKSENLVGSIFWVWSDSSMIADYTKKMERDNFLKKDCEGSMVEYGSYSIREVRFNDLVFNISERGKTSR